MWLLNRTQNNYLTEITIDQTVKLIIVVVFVVVFARLLGIHTHTRARARARAHTHTQTYTVIKVNFTLHVHNPFVWPLFTGSWVTLNICHDQVSVYCNFETKDPPPCSPRSLVLHTIPVAVQG